MLKRLLSFSVVSLFISSVSFVFLPFITATLSLEEFATYSFYYTLCGMLTSVCCFGTIALLSIEVANDENRSSFESLDFLLSVNLIVNLSAVIILLLLGFRGYLILLPVLVFSRAVFLYISHVYRVKGNLKEFALYNGLGYLLMFLVPLSLAYFIDLDGLEFLMLMGAVLLISSSIGLVNLRLNEHFKFRFIFPHKSKEFKFCFFSAAHSLVASLVTMSDRFVLKALISDVDFAVYSLAAMLVGALSMVFSIVNQNIAPSLFKELTGDKNTKKVLVSFGKSYLLVILSLFGAFHMLIAPVLELFFDEKYLGAINIVRMLSIGVLFQAMYFFGSNLVFFKKKSSEMFVMSAICGVFGLLMSIVLFHSFAMEGVIIAFILTWFLFSGVTFYRALKGLKSYVKNLQDN